MDWFASDAWSDTPETEMNTARQSTGHWPLVTLCLLLVAAGLFSTGCRSTGESGGGRFASVKINGLSTQAILATTAAVFREDGYQAFPSSNGLICEKAGSRANTISRDGLVAAQAGAQTLVRVRARVEDLGNGSHRLQCQTYMVSGAGDSFFEEEHRLANFRSGPYQKLLEEVAKRLKQP